MKKKLVLLIICLVFISSVYFYSQKTISHDILSAGGSASNSSLYSIGGSAGQPFTGPTNSTNFVIQSGFWNQLSVNVLLPDLAGTDISVIDHDTLQRDSVYSINFSIKNQGAIATSDSFLVKLYISNDVSIDTFDTPLDTCIIDTIFSAGDTLHFTTDNIEIPDTLSNGSFYFGMIMDSENDIPEIDETNNTYSSLEGTVVIPVELVAFNFTIEENRRVVLRWTTASETNNLGFEIEKSIDRETFHKIGFVEGHGTTVSLNNYTLIDEDINHGIYFYRLKQIDFNGFYNYSKLLQVEIKTPENFSLFQNFPNPFNAETVIKYQIPVLSFVTITIYNVNGQQVKMLVNETNKPGFYKQIWDGTDNTGNTVSSGMFIYVIRTNKGYTAFRKMVLLK